MLRLPTFEIQGGSIAFALNCCLPGPSLLLEVTFKLLAKLTPKTYLHMSHVYILSVVFCFLLKSNGTCARTFSHQILTTILAEFRLQNMPPAKAMQTVLQKYAAWFEKTFGGTGNPELHDAWEACQGLIYNIHVYAHHSAPATCSF